MLLLPPESFLLIIDTDMTALPISARVDLPRDIIQSPDVGVVGDTFELSITLLQEAAALATRAPYLGVFAGILLDIVRIKGVRLLLSPR